MIIIIIVNVQFVQITFSTYNIFVTITLHPITVSTIFIMYSCRIWLAILFVIYYNVIPENQQKINLNKMKWNEMLAVVLSSYSHQITGHLLSPAPWHWSEPERWFGRLHGFWSISLSVNFATHPMQFLEQDLNLLSKSYT